MSLFDVLDDAADEAVAGRTLDPTTVLERAQRPEYRRPLTVVVGHGSPRWRARRGLPRHPVTRGLVLAAAAVVVLALALAAVPAVQRAAPLPADTPTGAGTVRRTLYTPPQWTPSVTERPISRAVYVVSSTYPETGNVEFADYPIPPATPWLVGADGGEYRSLPVPDGWDPRVGDTVRVVALSPDGARVAWVPTKALDSRFATRLDLVDVRTGDHRTLPLTGSGRRGFGVDGIAFSPDGAHLAVWGTDVRGAGGDMTSDQVVVVDVRTATVRQICVLGAGAVRGAAWAADGALVTGGCDPQPADRGSLQWPGVTSTDVVTVRAGLEAAADGQSTLEAAGAPTGSAFRPVVLGTDGRRLDVVRGSEEATAPFTLRPSTLQRGPGGAVDLGTHAGAVPLAAGRSGVVVTRWDAVPDAPLPGFGRSDVVRFRADGTVDVLSRSSGVMPRVGAVAAGVLDDARPVDGVRPGAPLLDTAWWTWTAGRAIGWVARTPVGDPTFWFVVAVFAGSAGVRRVVTAQVRRTRRRRGTDPDAPPGQLVRWSGVLVVVAVLGASVLVPTTAPRVEASDARTPAVPGVVRDQRLLPPKAFDTVGEPRTTAVGVVFLGTVAGHDGVFATDAATGALARIDGVPGLGDGPPGGPTPPAVSPNGRWLSDGSVVIDLATARWEKLPEPSDVISGGAPATTVVVLDDGRVVRVTETDKRVRVSAVPTRLDSTFSSLQAPEPAVELTGLPDAVALAPAGPDQVVVRVMQPDQTDPPTKPEVYLVDLAATGTGSATPLSTNQTALVTAYGGTTLSGSRTGLTLVDPPAAGEKDGRGATLPVAGGVDGLWLTDSTAIILGASGSSDLAVTRTPLADVRAGSRPAPETVVRVDPSLLRTDRSGGNATCRVNAVTVASQVVATARVVDPPADPWWAGVAFWR